MDEIRINNLEIFANHGVFPEENKLGQKFVVSCTLYLDTRKAGKGDRLEDSVHYGLIAQLIKKEMESHTFALIECVAEHLADIILDFDEKIREVEIEVKKPWAPVGLPLEDVSVTIRRKWHEVYVAFGSNMGERDRYIEQGIEALKKQKDCRILKVSSVMETEPYGVTEQNKFLNGVLKMETKLMPYELLDVLHRIEAEAKRERKFHWGPRTLDLDILLYDDLIWQEDDLCIPHVDMQNRFFVLGPMAEIAPYKRHPVYGLTIKEMLEQLEKTEKQDSNLSDTGES